MSFVVGQSNGRNNEGLFLSRDLTSIDWINANFDGSNATIKLQALAKKPKAEAEQFPPTFTTEELLQIAGAQLPQARRFQNLDVFIDGIVPVALALKLSDLYRYARSVSVNVPREGGWKKVSERKAELSCLAVGDKIKCRIFGNVVAAEVKAVSDTGVQVAELDKRRGQRVWIYESFDLMGWADA